MKKYYAKQCNPDVFDYDIYYSEDEAMRDKFWAGGNRDFKEINPDLVTGLAEKLEDLRYDVQRQILDEDPENQATYQEVVYEWFTKEDGTKFTEDESKKLYKLANNYYYCKSYEENNIICEVLEMIYDEPFINGTLRGCCQGDWLEYICPEKMESSVKYIESVLFGTGTEFAITESAYDEEPDFTSPDVDLFCAYTEKWRPEDIKEFIAEQVGATAEEVVVKTISRSYSVMHYEYEEI